MELKSTFLGGGLRTAARVIRVNCFRSAVVFFVSVVSMLPTLGIAESNNTITIIEYDRSLIGVEGTTKSTIGGNDDFSDSYHNVKSLRDSLFSSDQYSPALRPILHQTKAMKLQGFFSLVSIVSLDDVKQELVTNGFFVLGWQDEMRGWDPEEYGGLKQLEILATDVWRPRLQIINALEERNPFQDDDSFTVIMDWGFTIWEPAGLFRTYCQLDLQNFPFDVQSCKQQICPVNHNIESVIFDLDESLHQGFFFPNSGWELVSARVTNETKELFQGQAFSCPTFYFELKRRPTTIVLNVILPVVLLSLLNNFVFLIPLESGENIGYAITVLLSMTVYLSTVSSLTPQVTNVVPYLTVYLFVLLLISVLTVSAIIFTEFLHTQDEVRAEKTDDDQQKQQPDTDNTLHSHNTPTSDKKGYSTVSVFEDTLRAENTSTSDKKGYSTVPVFEDTLLVENTPPTSDKKGDQTGPDVSKEDDDDGDRLWCDYGHRRMARRINLFFFGGVMAIWSVSTLWYFVSTNT